MTTFEYGIIAIIISNFKFSFIGLVLLYKAYKLCPMDALQGGIWNL